MKNLEIKSPVAAIAQTVRKVQPYSGVLLFLLLAAIYGFIVLRINSLSNPTIDQSAVVGEAKSTPVPRIDANAAKQLQALKDNSVNVQTLFDQSRTNPFNE